MKIDFLKKELWDLLRTIQDSKDIVICPIAKAHNMTPLQLRLLMEINAAEEDLSLSRLSKVLEMNNGNVSTLCKKMEQRGFLTRERRLDDERYIALKISPDGKRDPPANGCRHRTTNTACFWIASPKNSSKKSQLALKNCSC